LMPVAPIWVPAANRPLKAQQPPQVGGSGRHRHLLRRNYGPKTDRHTTVDPTIISTLYEPRYWEL
jgi:hypothetical protein